MNNTFPLIIPTVEKDYIRINRDLIQFFQLLPINEIIFIGPNSIEPLVKKDAEKYGRSDIKFLNENELLPYDDLMNAIQNRITTAGFKMQENSRPGWYYQQFLKMAYHSVCDCDYYMSWDSDTIPLHPIEMFSENGKPFFDVKAEYNPGYFKTIRNMFGFEKVLQESFISEHMLFKKEYMKELIAEIMALPVPGDSFFEKIFYSIDLDNLKHGFAEFETYGTWVTKRHSDAYEIRSWSSLRMGSDFFRSDEMSDADIHWLAQSFDAITFESYNEYNPELAALFHNPEWRNRLSAKQVYQAVLESGHFGSYAGGMIKKDGILYAT